MNTPKTYNYDPCQLVMKPTLNNDMLPISDEINGILIKYCSALAEITKLNNDNARLREENARLREAAQAVVDRWETPTWKDAEPTAAVIYRLRDILANAQGQPPR